MPTLPNLSGKAAMKAFQRGGWTKVRQRGSHVVMVKDGSMATQGGLSWMPFGQVKEQW
jgi:predicted RNA binding protein YcfA (HicA-like mRNA interferase family)